MSFVSLYSANRLWHKGEIAEKGKRKEEKRSILRPIVGLRLTCNFGPKRGFKSNGKQSAYETTKKERPTSVTILISLGYTVCFYT